MPRSHEASALSVLSALVALLSLMNSTRPRLPISSMRCRESGKACNGMCQRIRIEQPCGLALSPRACLKEHRTAASGGQSILAVVAAHAGKQRCR